MGLLSLGVVARPKPRECDYCPVPAIVRAYNGNCSDGEECCPTESLCPAHLEETKRAYSDILDSLKITPIGD